MIMKKTRQLKTGSDDMSQAISMVFLWISDYYLWMIQAPAWTYISMQWHASSTGKGKINTQTNTKYRSYHSTKKNCRKLETQSHDSHLKRAQRYLFAHVALFHFKSEEKVWNCFSIDSCALPNAHINVFVRRYLFYCRLVHFKTFEQGNVTAGKCRHARTCGFVRKTSVAATKMLYGENIYQNILAWTCFV